MLLRQLTLRQIAKLARRDVRRANAYLANPALRGLGGGVAKRMLLLELREANRR